MGKQERTSLAGRSNKRKVTYFCDDQEEALEAVSEALTEGMAIKIVVLDDRGGNGGIEVEVTKGG